MKHPAKIRAKLLFDEILDLKKVEGHLEVIGRIDGKRVYSIIKDSLMIVNDLLKDFEESLNFLERINEDPSIFVMVYDLISDRKDPNKSVFPPHPTHFLLDKKGVGKWYNILSNLSGKVPIISIVFDKHGASSTFPICLSDVVVMTEESGMSIGREDVVKKLFGKSPDYDKLGSARMHESTSGSVDFVGESEEEVFSWVKKYISFMPEKRGEEIKKGTYQYTFKGSIKDLIPENPMYVLDMDKLISYIVDDSSFLEIKKNFAKEIVIGFATFEGIKTGLIANRSLSKGGILFPESCHKMAKFISICDSFGLPIIFLADSCGFMVGEEVEQKGIIKSGSLLFKTIATSRTPKLSIAVRRDYTAGVYAMGGGNICDGKFFALPSAIITIYSENVGKMLTENDEEKEKRFKQMMEGAKSPQKLYKEGYIDKIIDYEDLRSEIVSFLKENKFIPETSKGYILIL